MARTQVNLDRDAAIKVTDFKKRVDAAVADQTAMAKSKGLSTTYVLLRHALRPSLFSLVTAVGLQTGALIGGALVVEVIFALPGIGNLTVTSAFSRDYLVVQGTVVLIAVAYVVVNFVVDVVYALVDPRVRHGVA